MIAIADAIRNKLNIEDLMTIDQMPDLIMRIESVAKPDPTITFSIELVDDRGTVEYSVPIGTTWEAAINTILASELYTEGLYLEGNKIRCDSSYQPYNIDYRDYVYSLVDEDYNRVSKNDIIKKATYHFEYLWFTTNLGEEEYEFDYGMTLGEWCDSEYNVDNYILKADGFWNSNEEYYNESYNINNNTVIESNMSIDLIKYIPMINYSISPIRDEDDLYLTCASNATWESMLGIQIGEYSDPLEEDEYGNLYVYETIPPEEIQSRFIREYEYHLVDENNNKVHKDDIITSQNYHFEYLKFRIEGYEYDFDYGMTLGEWCDSEYNTDKYYYSGVNAFWDGGSIEGPTDN